MNSKTKIIYAIDVYQDMMGGAELHVRNIIEHLPRHIYEIICISNSQVFLKLLNESVAKSVQTHLVNKKKGLLGELIYLKDLYQFFIRQQPTIIHLHKLRTSIWGRIAGYIAHVPIIISTVHGAPSYWKFNPVKNFINRFLNMITLNVCGTVSIALTNIEKNALIYDDWIQPSKVWVIPCGIFNYESFLSVSKRTTSHDSLIAIGRLSWEKDFKTLIQAMAIIYKQYPAVILHLVGNGPEREMLERLAQDCEASKNIIFHGEVAAHEIPGLLSNSGLCVISSLWESFSYVAVEAMFSGLPIVATKVGALPEVIINEQGGILVQPQNPQELAEAIIELIIHPKQQEQYGMFNRDWAIKMYKGESMIEKLDELYITLIQKRY
jgi:glycosyltransferase involved in cell wall biosynthesis